MQEVIDARRQKLVVLHDAKKVSLNRARKYQKKGLPRKCGIQF
jgi:hypothetical protein